MVQHIVNISGGKDSTATYLLAVERGMTFRAVTADTGHEAPETYDFIRGLSAATGGPEVEVARADFSAEIERKRKTIAEKWPRDGVPAEQVARALELLRPTGIPFLDLCLLKGRFPSTQARFCTEYLKSLPIYEQVMLPALASGPVIRWQGERREESPRRANLPTFHKVRDPAGRYVIYRPILDWSAEDTFAIHKRHGLQPNPLYLKGASRVGCFPCIMCRKSELAVIAIRYPEQIVMLREWEKLVAAVSKRARATFFAADKTPEGAAMAAHAKATGIVPDKYPGIDAVADWARTTRGGRQYDMILAMDDHASCSSDYGLCE